MKKDKGEMNGKKRTKDDPSDKREGRIETNGDRVKKEEGKVKREVRKESEDKEE